MPDTNETVLVKYIANADLRDGTEIIRLADAEDGTSRELKRGGPAVAVTAAEVAVLAQGFEIKVAKEDGTFEEDGEGAEETAVTESAAPSAPTASSDTDTSGSTPAPAPALGPEPEPAASPTTTATPSGPEAGSSGTEPDAGTTPSTTPGTLGR